MAHFAKLDSNNIVTYVTVGRNEDEDRELELSARTGDTYRRTSYNTNGGVHAFGGTPFRKNYAGIGYTYDVARNAFIAPKPFASWLLNEDTCQWGSPVPYPADVGTPDNPKRYTWDEATTSWVETPDAP